MRECPCSSPDRAFAADREDVGVDETNGRFGQVALLRCRSCARLWLDYHVAYEGFTGSGRWFRGVISEEQAATLQPATAAAVLSALEWHLYGGSYFGHSGRAAGRVQVDL